jgi:hypothetical protein
MTGWIWRYASVNRPNTRRYPILWELVIQCTTFLSGNLDIYNGDIWSIGGAQYKKRCAYTSKTF